MKMRKIHRLSALVLYAMLAITLVVSCLFFFGGEASSDRLVVMDPDVSQPALTDLLLYWLYALLIIILAVTFVAFGWKLVGGLLQSPRKALKSLSGIVLLSVVMLVSWWAGSSEPVILSGYEGAENTPFWSRIADMFLFSIYGLIGIVVLLMIVFALIRRYK